MRHITHQPISVEKFLGQKPEATCGASVNFVGIVRNHQDGRPVQRLFYECYESMADKQIGLIVDRIKEDFGVDRIHALHRVGWLEVGDVSVIIEVSSPHREEAFFACKAVIDEVKQTVPIWKKEIYTDGTREWVSCAHAAPHLLHEGPWEPEGQIEDHISTVANRQKKEGAG